MKELRARNQIGELSNMLGSPFKADSKYKEDFKKFNKIKQSGKFMPIDDVS